MHKKLTTSAAAGLLLLGASGVAMAQEVPTSRHCWCSAFRQRPDLVPAPPIVVGGPCVDAVQALRAVPLELQDISVIQESFLTFVLGTPRTGANGAILVCAPEGTATPVPPPPHPAASSRRRVATKIRRPGSSAAPRISTRPGWRPPRRSPWPARPRRPPSPSAFARSILMLPAGSCAIATLPRHQRMTGLPSWASCRFRISRSISLQAGLMLANPWPNVTTGNPLLQPGLRAGRCSTGRSRSPRPGTARPARRCSSRPRRSRPQSPAWRRCSPARPRRRTARRRALSAA